MSGAKLYVLILGLSLACFLMALDMSIITVAIPVITEKFHSTADIGWYVSAYLLSVCSLQPLSGKLYANFSLKVGTQPDNPAVPRDLTVPSGLSWRIFWSSKSDLPFLVLLPHRQCSLLAVRSQAWAGPG
jgi:MFS family permease